MDIEKELEEMLKPLIKIAEGYSTCSIDNIRNKCVTFCNNNKYLEKLKNLDNINNLLVLVPNGLSTFTKRGIRFYKTNKDVDLLFTLFNNISRQDEDPSINDVISPTAIIHPSTVIGAEGLKISIYKDKRIFFKHYGNVVIEDDVRIGANSVVQRGRLDSTKIGKGTVISSIVNVGHNTTIGENCVIAINSGISGSVTIGNNVWLGIGTLVRNKVNICDDVVIGMGSVVTKDITNPGFYIGNPCKFLRDIKPGERGF